MNERRETAGPKLIGFSSTKMLVWVMKPCRDEKCSAREGTGGSALMGTIPSIEVGKQFEKHVPGNRGSAWIGKDGPQKRILAKGRRIAKKQMQVLRLR
jgi:hypothetical protein